jgi:hypothetical protein
MQHRAVVLLLISTILLQGMLFTHHHAGAGTRASGAHAQSSHFHIPGVESHSHHPHEGGHHHGPGGHHHHHDDTDDLPETESVPVQKTDPLSDHDLTAVFIAAVDSFPGERSQTGDDGFHLIQWIGEFMPSTAVGKLSSAEATIMGHPPPKAGCNCPLYVQQLTLLI